MDVNITELEKQELIKMLESHLAVMMAVKNDKVMYKQMTSTLGRPNETFEEFLERTQAILHKLRQKPRIRVGMRWDGDKSKYKFHILNPCLSPENVGDISKYDFLIIDFQVTEESLQ